MWVLVKVGLPIDGHDWNWISVRTSGADRLPQVTVDREPEGSVRLARGHVPASRPTQA